MEEKRNIKWYIVLHSIFFIYALSSLFGKKAGNYNFLSLDFLIMYMGVITCMLVYAVIWQQVIKHLPLIMAYASRAVTVLWGVFFGVFLYNEKITLRQVFSLFLIIMGIILFAISDYKSVEDIND